MKLRLLIFSTLAIFLLNTVGYFPVFKVKQWLVQHKMETLIEETLYNDSLQCITISSENQHELHWQEENREFWYKGLLYDIVRLEKKGTVVHYYCIADAYETKLSYQFVENIKKQTDNTKDENNPLSNFLKKVFELDLPPSYSPHNPIVFIANPENIKVSTPYINRYASSFSNRIDPPPKQVI